MDYKPQVGDAGVFYPNGYARMDPQHTLRGKITRVWSNNCVNLELEDTSRPTSVLVANPAAMPVGLGGYYFVPDALALLPASAEAKATPGATVSSTRIGDQASTEIEVRGPVTLVVHGDVAIAGAGVTGSPPLSELSPVSISGPADVTDSGSELAAALREAAALLRKYEKHHRDKAAGADDSDTYHAAFQKAEVNANMAAKFEALLAQHDAATAIGAAMDFGGAIRALKAGKRVARVGWNGKGMWLALSCDGSRRVPYQSFWSSHNAEFAKEQGGYATVLPCITMKTATGEILMGWLASQTDQLAEDWLVLDTVQEPQLSNRTYSFSQFVQYGLDHGGKPVTNGMPWSFQFEGRPVTHENDDLYIIADGSAGGLRFARGRLLVVDGEGRLSVEDYAATPLVPRTRAG